MGEWFAVNDLATAVLTLIVIGIFAVLAGWQISKRHTERRVHLVAVAALFLMAGYLTHLWNRPVLAQLVPVSSLVILANWLPIWGSFFAGIYLAMTCVNPWRRGFVGSFALGLCAYSAVQPLLGTGPVCEADSPSTADLQFQTTPFTCSAACAASLLRLHGIEATESELAELCLTREGTHWMGLFRGLKLKTEDTAWDVSVAAFDRNRLLQRSAAPCVLAVDVDITGFEKGVDHGFCSDAGHSVVYLQRYSDDCITVFDPSPDFGVDHWDHRILKCIKRGVTISLIPRDPTSPESLLTARRIAAAVARRPRSVAYANAVADRRW
ncbi:hypothetical protein Fuma_00581 [Fuerstiella marisgermanici]|uniref:Peptidase C39 domain-containing protein n=1 Tax=Fuerstiella marisgermanici TaxID=1891926 RepID=A0A1P8WAB0_9PLAN|nr:hypothetical protein Fuma_00581 [Fuerstiella marisgermanici]